MFKVTSIQQAKKRESRVNVYLDNEFWIGMDKNDLLSLGLFRGKEIDEAEKKSIEKTASFSKLYEKALNYTFVRPRSEKEMKDYLQMRRGLSPEESDSIVEKLKDKKYLDDRKFAEWYVENRINFGVHGENKIYAELLKKGINSRLGKEVLKSKINAETEDDTLEKIRNFAQKSIGKIKADSDFQRNQKLTQKLLSRGFSYSDIKKALKND